MAHPHTHTWRQSVTMLTLPDHARYYEAVILWRCTTCPKTCHATGMLHHQTRAMSPDDWEAHLVRERAAGGLLAQEAAKQEQRKVY